MTSYRDRHLAGLYVATNGGAEPKAEVEAEENGPLPRTHAELDELASERGHEWSGEDLTVAEKRAELG